MKAKALIEAEDFLSKEELLRLTRKPEVWVGLIPNKHGYDGFVSRTKGGLQALFARYCRKCFNAADVQGESDEDVISMYFDADQKKPRMKRFKLSAPPLDRVWVAVIHAYGGHNYTGYDEIAAASNTRAELDAELAKWGTMPDTTPEIAHVPLESSF